MTDPKEQQGDIEEEETEGVALTVSLCCEFGKEEISGIEPGSCLTRRTCDGA